MKYNSKPLLRHRDIVVQRLDDETLIYDLTRHKAFCLNETSSLVYELCDGNLSVAEIAHSASRTTGVTVPEELVLVALDQFDNHDLLLSPSGNVYEQYGVSRRAALKALGTASMIALPVISGLVAPLAAAAQSLAGVCGSQVCDCSDAFVIANPPGTECSGPNLVTPCPTTACRCFVRDNDPIGSDVCAA